MLGKQFDYLRDPNKPKVWYIEGERWRLGRKGGKWSQKYARFMALRDGEQPKQVQK
jgi:hypothetical protein